MKITTVFYITSVFIFITNVNSYNEDVQYYENLINEEMSRAQTFPLPTDSTRYTATSKKPAVYGIFDYIVVGAGSAGSVVASRLSEIKHNDVLLLEAGGPETNFTDIPAMDMFLRGLEFNWNYNSTPQTTSCLGMIKHECPYPRGKVLGGSSTINGVMYVRGNEMDYDMWEEQGNPGWSYKDVLPYFIKSEKSHFYGDEGYHGKQGNWNVELRDSNSPQLKAFIEANEELGRQRVDYNGKQQLGVSPVQSNIVCGRRDSSAKAFLKPASHRPNLKILTRSLVTKILIKKLTKKAYGVIFSNGDRLYIAKAKKEIIISAGAINSPQLLMLSGIGPKEHLKHFGIPVIAPLSVGDNFQDHAAYHALIFESDYVEPVRPLDEYVKEYLEGDGLFTYAGNIRGLAFTQTKYENRANYPDVEFLLVASNDTNVLFQRALHYSDESYNAIWAKVDPTNTFTIIIVLLHPKSRGTIRLKSNDPFDYPLIDSQILSDKGNGDIEVIYQGIEKALELLKTKAFKKINAKLMHAPLPACKGHKYLSREYWYCQLRQLTFNLYHPMGTCKMGPNPSKGAVVDHELKVHGIKYLRVADASIFPIATSGHPSAPSVMIGEKVADMILNKK